MASHPRRQSSCTAVVKLMVAVLAVGAADLAPSAAARRESNMIHRPAIGTPVAAPTSKGSMKLGPIRLWNKLSSPSFVWQAAVNRTTALASAREESQVPSTRLVSYLLYQAACQTKNADLLDLSQKMFTSYFPWLCSGRVTFGLLKAVVHEKDRSIEIKDRLFGVKLLRFGQPQGNRLSAKTTSSSQVSTIQEPEETTTQCIWSFPITGGLMTVSATPQENAKNKASSRAGSRGSMVFIFNKTTWQQPQQDGTNLGDDKNMEQVRCSIRTELVDYRPAVVGRAPANWIRTGLYLGSQSFIHAAVMWRFHGYCRSLDAKQIERL
ncbi:hypothetical protein ACA910_015813 [Epithemia clementina (nom. ined.)]